MPDERLLDEAVFRELQEAAGAEFAAELANTFAEEATVMLAELQRCLASGNADNLRRAAHSLKSNALTFGASRLADEARALELGGLATAHASGLAELHTTCKASLAALKTLAAPPHG